MRYLWVLFLSFYTLFVDQFDMFDEDDNLQEEFIVEEKLIDGNIRLNHTYKDNSKDENNFYLKLYKDTNKYLFDFRFIADEDTYFVNIPELYYTYAISQKILMEVGRVNIKEGISRGYNPTIILKEMAHLPIQMIQKR